MEYNEAFDDLQLSKRSWTRTIFKLIAVAICLLIAFVGGVYWLAQQTPDFYKTAMEMSAEEAFVAGESLEVAALYLRNDLVEQETWVAEFPEDQINGWLASDLPRKFSTMLPDEVRDPRVGIEPRKFQIAVTTEIEKVETVLVAAVEFFPTEVSNEFGFRVLSVHAGWLPIPISFFTVPATELLERYRIQAKWYEDGDGAPVAVLKVPKSKLSYDGKQIVVEQLEIADGSVRMAGRSKPLTPPTEADSSDSDPETQSSEEPTTEALPVSD